MARKPTNGDIGDNAATPKEYPQTNPPIELYPTSDIRFVILEIGKLSTKVERLVEDVNKSSEKIGDLSKKMAMFETAAKTIAGAIGIFALVFWWAFGDYVKSVVTSSIRTAFIEQGAKAAPNATDGLAGGGKKDTASPSN
ncbi:hypothetical protein [Methylosinus sp. RM1]|uniref:hypothetical protein n=1 Tax=Methylosinus sp. RM1 TaxID=2583817 RepID=UPI001409E969|nr:hypothetical protein [Methylosinus sp. RM1]